MRINSNNNNNQKRNSRNSNPIKATKQIKKYVLSKGRVGISLIGIIAVILSFFFEANISYLFKLKPDTSAISGDALQVHFVDVGQGDAILFRFPNNKTMIVDSGPGKAKEQLVEYIDKVFFEGEDKKVFDYVVLTHSDEDHCGNMQYVIENYEIGEFYRPNIYSPTADPSVVNGKSHTTKVYAGVIESLYKNVDNIHFSEEGMKILDGDITYATWYSPLSLDMENIDNYNDYSPIMVVESYGKKICLTGDASIDMENDVMLKYDLPDVDVLKLGHHGSKTSTSLEFLNDITPEQVVICVGEGNKYNHPNSETLQRLADYDEINNTSLYENRLSTMDKGNIILYFDNENFLGTLTLGNINDYLFIDWYVIAIVISIVLITIMLLPKRMKSA